MTVDVDLAGVTTREEFHERVRQALPVPDWYGNNLDAFHDVLSEQPELTVRLLHATQLPPRYAAALERICADSQGKLCIVEDCENDDRDEEDDPAVEERTEDKPKVDAEETAIKPEQ